MNRLLLFVTLLFAAFPSTRIDAQIAGPAGVNSGIVLWLDGSNVNNTTPSTNPSNGSSLSTWKDVSGNGNDATVFSGQNTPTVNSSQLNGHDVVQFTRTTNFLGTVYEVTGVDVRATTMPQLTIFTVYRQGSYASTDWQCIWGNDDGSWDRFFMSRFGSNNGIVSVGAPTNYVSVPNAGVQGDIKLLTAVYDNGTTNGSTIYFNGSPVQTVTDNTSPTAAQTDLRIGFDGNDNPFNGDIAEMIVYDRKLTDCEIQTINRYLGFKYNVTISTATVTPSDKAYFCTGNNILLTANTATTYQWLKDGVAIPSATSQTYTASAYGKYQVVTGNGTCTDTSAATTVYEAASVMYVDSSVATSGSGLSWASPFKTVGEALDVANNTNCNIQVWVKKGTYYPTGTGYANATSRDSSLRIIRNNVKLYGGFAGTETLLSQRNYTTNVTILSGDIGTANDSTDNSYHVMTIVGNTGSNIDSNTVVDGFTIYGGKAENTGTFTINGMAVYRGAGGGINVAGLGAGAASSPLLEHLTFNRNNAEWGGGIYGQGHQGGVVSPVIRNCNFTSNRANSQGGALNFYTENATGVASPVITSCTFTSNYAGANGGAGHFNGVSPAVCNPSITNCTFASNSTDPTISGGIFGGALVYYGAASTPTIKSCVFNNNRSSYGGAIASAGPLQLLTVDSSSFTGNSCGASGGGIVFQSAAITITNSAFTANKANTGGGISALGGATYIVNNCDFVNDSVTAYGAGMYNGTANTTTINNSRFLNNYGAVVGAIDNPGGGITNITKTIFYGNKSGQIGGVMNNYNGTTNFINCVLANNSTTTTANVGGGTVHIQGGTTVNFYNSTLYNNTSASTAVPNTNTFAQDASGNLNLYNTIVWGNAAIQIAGGGTPNLVNSLVRGATVTAPNLAVDPKFFNTADPDGTDNVWGTADDGLALTKCSQAINAGNNANIPVGLTTDLTAATRIQQTTVDMGAYETALTNIVVFQSVSIGASPAGAICSGTNVTFTATPVNGGASPAYQWQLNGTNVGTATATYSNTALVNNDVVSVRMISSAQCPYPDTVFSNNITMTVNPTPAISTVTATNPTCAANDGKIVINGLVTGNSYVINYSLGGVAQAPVTQTAVAGAVTLTGLISGSYTNIYVVLGPCASNVINGPYVLTAPVAPSITSQPPASTTVCEGTATTTFGITATGTALTYQWQVSTDNGVTWTNVHPGVPYTGINTATLTVSNAPFNLNGSKYRCVVTGFCSPAAVSNVAAYTVNRLPFILTNPATTFTCAGSSASMTVSAVGTGITYQWEVNTGSGFTPISNNTIYSGATSSTLTMSGVPATMNGYRYHCVITGICSPSVTTTTQVLYVNTPPTITMQPSDKIVCMGSTTQFLVSVSGQAYPAFSYQWQVDDGSGYVNLSNNSTYSGVKTGALTVTANTPLYNFKYRCIISTGCAPDITSNDAMLTVYDLPVILGITKTGPAMVCPKTAVTFTVGAAGSLLNYQWQVNMGSGFVNVPNTPQYAGQTSPSLKVLSASSNMNGYLFRCIVSGACAPPVTSSALSLGVYDPVGIAFQPATDTVCEEGNTNLTIGAYGGGLLYQWQRKESNGSYIDVVNIPPYSGANTATLTFTNTPAYVDGTIYRCAVTETVFCNQTVYTTDIPVAVNLKPVSTPAKLIVPYFGTATFTVPNTSGEYQWQENHDNTGFMDLQETPPYSGTQTNTLVINPIGFDMSGNKYRCVVKGSICAPLITTSTESGIWVDPALSVNKVNGKANNAISVYPNPVAEEKLNINFTNAINGKTDIRVLNKLGQLVKVYSVDFAHSNTTSIDVNGMAAGVYTLQIINDAEQINATVLFTKQ
ncbi:MAG: T9SS type A sorting domain-containing protein [Bacteroidetes bacterium]|nr:T9SS type A sorting domain-containing protein [Bacteroidota bacterium]